VYVVIIAVIILYSFGQGYISTAVLYELFRNMNSDRGINIAPYIYPFLYSGKMAVLQGYFNLYINRVIVL